ncbi:MAG: SRPBCC family protein [Gemmatimonadota bacterium]|nr:SRPBCC family protein [Gemmatimonadota bacterium]
MRSGLKSVAVRILAALTGLLVLFIAVGIALPRSVEVTRSIDVPATPDEVFPYLDDLEAWTEWTLWGDVESHIEASSRGTGATRVWDDPNIGSGRLTLTGVEPTTSVAYRAEVKGGLTFVGTLALRPRGSGVTVIWTESASWGLNPLMGWTGLTLEGAQGRQLEQSLARLAALFEPA